MASSMSIKWCRKNLEHFSQPALERLREEYPDVPMEVAECVDFCSLCTDVPFALRNGAIVHARDPRGLYGKLKQGMSFLERPPLPGTYAAVVASGESRVASGTPSVHTAPDDDTN